MKERLAAVQEKIHAAAVGCGRDPLTVKLVAVAKTQPIQMVKEAISAGASLIGENYIQEARDKFDALYREPAIWHFIGHLQTNKAKYAVRMFELIHTVDSFKLAAELNKQAAKVGKVQKILIQVNISGEASKSGVDPKNATALIRRISECEHVGICGLMTMPPFFDNPEKARPFFSALRTLKEKIAGENITGVSMQELSMGMSGDFQAAIEEGATMVRIGTALFGERG